MQQSLQEKAKTPAKDPSKDQGAKRRITSIPATASQNSFEYLAARLECGNETI
jgi:hypothetical protein